MPKLFKRFTTKDLLTHNNSVCNPSYLLDDGIVVYRDGRKEKTDDNTKLLKIGDIDNHLNITNCRTISVPGKDLSDPRLVKWRNDTYVVVTIITLRIKEDLGYLAHMDLLDIKTNRLLGITYSNSTHREKNWIFFEHGAELMCSRSLWGRQHEVLKLNGTKMEDHAKSDYTTRWGSDFGDIRNTSNFVYYDGLMWGCVHSHDEHLSIPATYYCGLFAFEPAYPFNVVKMSNVPLFNPRYKGDILYPNHLDIMNDGTFRIGMGVNEVDHFDIVTLSPEEVSEHLTDDMTYSY